MLTDRLALSHDDPVAVHRALRRAGRGCSAPCTPGTAVYLSRLEGSAIAGHFQVVCGEMRLLFADHNCAVPVQSTLIMCSASREAQLSSYACRPDMQFTAQVVKLLMKL